jgi:NADPH-dependent 2,4-dienoyl-CoA reductase/sulfur reductase-like enzyme
MIRPKAIVVGGEAAAAALSAFAEQGHRVAVIGTI